MSQFDSSSCDFEFEEKQKRNPELFASSPIQPRKMFAYDWGQGMIAPYVATTNATVRRVFELVALSSSSVVWDLGCGDGKLVIFAAKNYGCRAVGVELDRELVALARAQVEKEEVSDLVEIMCADLLQVDFGQASVVVIFLLPASLPLLFDKILHHLLRNPGTILVSIFWEVVGLKHLEINRQVADIDNDVKPFYMYASNV
mmetsp:Transcript_24968/g.34413  ORF Transcript_24968/g.34413 Transcript_24968/m.34413 type:complete len:201 (+) Transcript_24968:210-812(+)|eukprot:CAMPEP_0196587338 /NCGR_PEP_ID=MMETSP1081-20130531/57161_1 /TAXON_ID=36882 /ORGANISM="Pyramimonas amylifera, Strain CCMP720" /LENGTH=200 /DNA_ID=CAMNT_0041909497 /DNA_START=197 /DNA_END=799 /DNA_ORIENTATION=-